MDILTPLTPVLAKHEVHLAPLLTSLGHLAPTGLIAVPAAPAPAAAMRQSERRARAP